MKTGQRRSPLSYIPGYSNNGVIQLIIVSTVAYVMLGFCWAVIKIMYDGNEQNFQHIFLSNIAIAPLAQFKTHWWTVLTYGWFQFPNSFMELLSNMVWLYVFGSVVQMLVGYRQVIPLYTYCLVSGGIFYILSQFLPGSFGNVPATYLLGARAGILGMAVAAVTLTPNYRFYFTETFSIPIMLVAGVFAILMLVSTNFFISGILLLTGGGVTGFMYIKLLRAGYKPGDWIYAFMGKMESLVTPQEPVNKQTARANWRSKRNAEKTKSATQKISQKHIDEILDKINQKGYNSLSSEEKEILMRAGKDE